MKHQISLFLSILCAYNYIFCDVSFIPDLHKALITIVIMVKDEAEVIIPTLEPFVIAGIDSILVYDTGSTDGTQAIVSDYFSKKNIAHGYVLEEPFIDFAASRNRSLDLAEELFPNSAFFLMVDAEWYMTNVETLINFCKKNEYYSASNTPNGCYLVRLITQGDNIDNFTPRLLRGGKGARYHGVVHESIEMLPSGHVDRSVYFTYIPKETGQAKSKKRLKRDYQLLKKYLDTNPNNERTLFYLAQTCQFLDRWDEAIYYYKQRAMIGFISEERYLALYRIGCAIDHLLYEAQKNNQTCDYAWSDAMFYYLKAHEMVPGRIEPLVRIASHYLYTKEYATSYIFAHKAALVPYPEDNRLFVEKTAYDYTRYDILGQCALAVGQYAEGKNAVLKALQVEPDAQHLYHNLSVYSRYV